ncbi:MAG: hypothetical protein JRN20_18645 [Nitrososphaerota archaeon]|nr:hypothetical protein [Nitrososphaerota archaeon]
MDYRYGIPRNRFYVSSEHRIRMSDFDIRNALRALAMTGIESKEKILVFNHLLLIHRRVVIAQFKKYERKAKVTAKLGDREISVIAEALEETGIYPYSKFPRKMKLYKHALEKGISFSEAWNRDVSTRREAARLEEFQGAAFSDSGKDMVEYEEDKGYHREHGEWGRLFDQDGNQIYEDLSRGGDGWLYSEDGVRVERSKSESEEEESEDDSAENDF